MIWYDTIHDKIYNTIRYKIYYMIQYYRIWYDTPLLSPLGEICLYVQENTADATLLLHSFRILIKYTVLNNSLNKALQLGAISQRSIGNCFIKFCHTGQLICSEQLLFSPLHLWSKSVYICTSYLRLSGQLSTPVNKPLTPEGLCLHDSAAEARRLLLTLSGSDTVNFIFLWFRSFGGRGDTEVWPWTFLISSAGAARGLRSWSQRTPAASCKVKHDTTLRKRE